MCIKLKFVLFLLINLISCKNSHTEITHQNIEKIYPAITSYIKANPPFTTVIDTSVPRPIYEVFIHLIKNDTIISIDQRPYVDDSDIFGINTPEGILYPQIKPSHFMLFEKKYPLIIFDLDNIFFEKKKNKKLLIPHKYHFKMEAGNRPMIIWDFVIKNNQLVRRDLASRIRNANYLKK